MNRIPFSEPGHPYSAQIMYAENASFALDPAHPASGNRWGYVNMGFGVRKFSRVEDGVTFSDDELADLGELTLNRAGSFSDVV